MAKMNPSGKTSKLDILTNGVLRENPVLVLVLGTCPTLAVTTMAKNGLGMGLAATIVLLLSNVAISLLRKIIPDKVRIPSYIVLIAGFVTIVQLLVKAFAPDIDRELGIFLPLIVVNCIILGRAEMFANKNTVLDSALDAVGMGAGFTIALLLMGSIREILGSGTWMGLQILPESVQPMAIMKLAPGGFFVFGLLIALAALLTKKPAPRAMGCKACPNAALCGKIGDEDAGGGSGE